MHRLACVSRQPTQRASCVARWADRNIDAPAAERPRPGRAGRRDARTSQRGCRSTAIATSTTFATRTHAPTRPGRRTTDRLTALHGGPASPAPSRCVQLASATRHQLSSSSRPAPRLSSRPRHTSLLCVIKSSAESDQLDRVMSFTYRLQQWNGFRHLTHSVDNVQHLNDTHQQTNRPRSATFLPHNLPNCVCVSPLLRHLLAPVDAFKD